MIYMPPNGCLRVLDSSYGDEDIYGKQSRYLVEAIPLSDPREMLVLEPIARPALISEPAHTWCYYFAKAELFARDFRGLGSESLSYREAYSKGYKPEDPLEWLTFIEANAMIADFDRAERLSMNAIAQDPRFRKAICECLAASVGAGSNRE